jgi:surface protein
MGSMFYGATNFNQPIGNWDVSSVLKMTSMFMYASNFNQNISSWDVSSVYRSYDFSYNSPLSEENKPNFK